jgi:gluconate:H+ symporter, GntP family
MHPVPRSLTRATNRSFVALSLALGAGMTVTHHLVPPTPGPLAVAGLLGVDIGRMILYGGAMAILLIPVVVFYARWMGPRLDDTVDEDIKAEIAVGVGAHTERGEREADTAAVQESSTTNPGAATDGGGAAELHTEPSGSTPGVLRAFLPLLIPIVLIVGNTVSGAVAEESQVAQIFSFIGDPVVALLIGGLIALYTLVPQGTDNSTVGGWLTDAISSAGIILAITGAGGALGNVLRTSGVGDAMADAIAGLALPGFLIPFLIATLVRFAQGSGTVAMITAGSLTAPLLGTAVDLDPVLAALAATSGSMFFSYYNDSYFWVVTKFTGLDGTAALKGWSGITTALWAGSLVLLTLLNLIL